MAPKYVLNYFPVQGRAEVDRLMFHAAGVEFTDNKYSKEEWVKIKNDEIRFPLAQMPSLEVDGRVIVQSHAVHRYLAMELGFYGENNMERAVIDQITETLHDLMTDLVHFIYGDKSEEEKKTGIAEEYGKDGTKRKYALITNFLKSNNGGTGFIIGDKLSLADLTIVVVHDLFLDIYPNALDDYSEVKALIDRVKNIDNIKKYLAKR